MPSGPASANSKRTEVMSVSPLSMVDVAVTSPPMAWKAETKALTRAEVYGSPSSTATMRRRPSSLWAKSATARAW